MTADGATAPKCDPELIERAVLEAPSSGLSSLTSPTRTGSDDLSAGIPSPKPFQNVGPK